MGFMRSCAIAVLILLMPVAAQDRHAVLVDRSGSMRPYYDQGLIQQITNTLMDTLRQSGTVDLYAFSTDLTRLRTPADLVALPFGQSTLLDRTISRAIQERYRLAWMITDNVEDEPGAIEAGNTEMFYRILRSDPVKRVTIFPLLQSPGHAGIVVYGFLLDEAGASVYDQMVTEFQRNLGTATKGTEALRMKPLDRNTVDVKFLRGGAASGATSEKTYSEGDLVHEELEIRFQSKFDHLEIVDAKIEVPEAKAEFQPGSLLTMDQRQVKITPQMVTRMGAGDETEQIYVVSVDLGAVRLKRDLRSLWRAAWGKSIEEATIPLSFRILVPQKNFRLRPSFLRQYNASSLAEARASGKVYAVDRLPALMGELVTPVRAESPIAFRVRYPWWPAVFWIVLLLVCLGGLAVLIKMLSGLSLGAQKWVLVAESDRGVKLDSMLEENGNVTVQKDIIGLVRRHTFEPQNGTSVEAAKSPIDLNVTPKFSVRTAQRRVVSLTFSLPDKSPAETKSTYIPTKR